MKRICLALLLASSTAAAQEKSGGGASPEAASPTTTSQDSTFYDGNHFGLQFDVGVPAGVALAVVARPWSFLRVNAGVGYDVAAFGVKGGVTLVPFHWGVVPTLGIEAGHQFNGDFTRLVSVSNPTVRAVLQDVGYTYISEDIGLEFGSQNRFVFYIRAGLTQVWAPVNNFQAAVDASNPPGRIKVADASATALLPAGRIGFVLYFF